VNIYFLFAGFCNAIYLLLCYSLVRSEKPSTVDCRQKNQQYKCATQQKLNA